MPKITYSADGFPADYGPALADTHKLEISWAEIIWAAISVGRGSLGHMVQHGVFSAYEFIYRVALIYANLRERPSGILTRSSAYNGLDQSEKGAISYFVGITFAKLFAHRLLAVPWLLHLDVYREQLQPILTSKSKPDFVGLNTSNDWVVLEAKGRTNDYEDSVLQKAKLQTQQLTTIAGSEPVLRVGCLTFFSAGTLRFAMLDPKGDQNRERIEDLPLSKEDLMRAYYRPIQVWLREAASAQTFEVDGHRYRLLVLPDFELSIGLPEEFEETFPGFKTEKETVAKGESMFVGADGLLVRLGSVWSSEKMRQEPQVRFRA